MEEVKQHPRSKRKRKNINVYFNKTKSTGQTKYITGEFQSNKCNSYVPYRSSYELAYLEQLEKDENVINFQYEPISLTKSNFGFAMKFGSKYRLLPLMLCSKAKRKDDFPVP